VDSSPLHSLVVVVVGVVEVKDNPNQVPEGWLHKDRYLHLLASSRDSLVGHVVVFIFKGIIHKRVVDRLWLMDLSWHRFSVITMAESAILVNVVLTFT
jgi:hypothetical protein